MAKSKLAAVNEKIADTVVSGYKKIETGVVDGYQKIEGGVVGGFTKITDKFVDQFLTRDRETVEEAKQRIAAQTGTQQHGNTPKESISRPQRSTLR